MPNRGYSARTIRGRGSFVLLNVPPGSLGTEEPESLWRWLPVAQVTDRMDIQLRTNETDVSRPWDEWTLWTMGRKTVDRLLIPVLYNPSLMAHSFVHENGVGRKFLDRTFPVWRIWTQKASDEGSVCMEFNAAVSQVGLSMPVNDLQRAILAFRVSGPMRWPSHSQLNAIIGTRGKDLIGGS